MSPNLREGVSLAGMDLELQFLLLFVLIESSFMQSNGYKKNSVILVRKKTIPSDRRMSAKLVSTFADRGCRVVSATDPHSR
jgi:hypothetical protein